MTDKNSLRTWARAQLLLGVAAAALAAPAGAMAQAAIAAPDKDVVTLDDIIVTAQKREQRLLDVPMAITAFTGEAIEQRGAASLQDLQFSVPGLSLVEQGPGQQRVQIRGVTTSNGLPTVGQYLDEMPISIDDQTQTLDLRLIDMKQIEVLRGPQGTLYGEGSMGGTIRFLTADPDLGQIGGSFEGQAGSVTDGATAWRVNGVVNLPLVKDRLGMRLVAGYENTGGWIDSSVTGKKDVNAAKILTLRGKLLAKFTDNIQASLLVLHQEQDQDYQNFGVSRKTSSRVAEQNNPKYDLANLVLKWDLGSANLTNSLGYQKAENNTVTDLSNTYVPLLPLLGVPAGLITSVGLGSTSDVDVLTDEVRLTSAVGGQFDWSAGAYGRHLKRTGTSRSATAPGSLAFNLISVTATFESKAWATFGELNWHATDALTITGGLRYFEETRTLESVNRSFGGLATASNSGKFSSLNPRLNISYDVSPTGMVYVSAAKGFRSGGFNLAATGGPPTYDPDELWTYEVGTKHQWFDRRLTFEGAAYYTDWTGVQSSFVPTGAAIGYVTNGGKVNGWGADVSMSARPATGLTLSATYGWNNLEYQGKTAEHAPGDPVDYAVRQSWSGSIDYRRPVVGNAEGFARLDYQHAGRSAIINRGSAVNVAIDPRDLVNAQLGVEFRRYEVSLFASNLFDEKTPIVPGPFGAIFQDIEPTPRIVGARFKATF
uniref:TonB-dependent receptor n=1 Tax=Caulobacter sp. (strain K31) TaxID=366602 RepID=B0SV26_CAUSK